MLFPRFTSGALLLAGVAVIHATQLSDVQERGSASAAVYWASNDPDGNYVLSASVNKKGQLTFANKFWTGGLGWTWSHRSQLAGAPVWSGGEFPVSATIDKKTGNVCGSYNSVSCYTSDTKKGLRPIPNTIRSLNLNSTTPPTGPAHTPSQVLFSEDGTILYASIKGAPGAPGFIAAWTVDLSSSALSAEFEKNTPKNGGALPFSMTFVHGTNAILATDPALGLSVYDFDGETTKAKKDVGVPIQGTNGRMLERIQQQDGVVLCYRHWYKQYAQPNGSSTIDLTIAVHRRKRLRERLKRFESFDLVKATKWAGVALKVYVCAGYRVVLQRMNL
ncbi:hypothetical protein DL96DRAFT_1556122 [Flagelloscypha sp. PMI_526]|nr:hypothetical protein DL96DRAFT_1556122 [Flagelloscypha sp. PMI_526]